MAGDSGYLAGVGRFRFIRFLITASIIIIFSAQVMDITSAASGTIVGAGDGWVVSHTNLPPTARWAGTIILHVDGDGDVPVYCADMYRTTDPGVHYDSDGYEDDPRIIYILHNYYPATSRPESLSDNYKAAAVQLAIWHFTSGLDISTGGSPSSIFSAARAIIADASLHTSMDTYSLELSPQSATNNVADPHTVTATLTFNGDPVSGQTISFRVSGANTAEGEGTTVGGNAPFIYPLSGDANPGKDTITATAPDDVSNPQGALIWENAGGRQPLVQAVSNSPLSRTATKIWVSEDCLSGYKLDWNGQGLGGWDIDVIPVTEEEPVATATTEADGFWQVCGLDAGAYNVREIPQTGWVPVSPESGSYDGVTSPTQNLNFTNAREGLLSLSGNVYNCKTGQGIPGMVVRVTDKTGSTWIAITDSNGMWQVWDLGAGDYTVCQESSPGWVQVRPEGCYSITLSGVSIDGLDFCDDPLVSVTKTADKSQAQRGEEITYTITICNPGETPMRNVVVRDVFNSQVEFIYPVQSLATETSWNIGEISPESCVTLSVIVRVPIVETVFSMGQGISGMGFVNVHNDYSTSRKGFGLKNCVHVTFDGGGAISDCAVVNIAPDVGTAINTREYGSGSYFTEEQVNYSAKNYSIEVLKGVQAVYSPTTFSLPENRSINYTTLWIEKHKAKNYLTGTSMTEEYTFAKKIDRDGYMKVDKNESILAVESEIEGKAHLGFLKKTQPNGTARSEPIFELSEDYAGSFKIRENVSEYGSNVQSNKSASGVGFVAADKRIGSTQRTYEYGTGSYSTEEEIQTYSSYMAKDIEVASAPTGYNYSPSAYPDQYLKWKEGMWSKSRGTQLQGGWLSFSTCPSNETRGYASYIGEEFSHLDYLKKETVARGLNEMNTEAQFEGTAQFRTMMGRSADRSGIKMGYVSGNDSSSDLVIDTDEVYVGRYEIARKVLLTGVSKYNFPHVHLAKEGRLREVKEEGINKTFAEYTIFIQNDGNRALGPIYVRDLFPWGTEYVNSSLKPSRLTPGSANWTMTHLPVGGYATIDLRLNVTQDADDLVNRVDAAGGYPEGWALARNFTVIERVWLTCCPPRIDLEKEALANAATPGTATYRLIFRNTGNRFMAARLTDYLPEAMKLLAASVEPQEYGQGLISWIFNDVAPGEPVEVVYTVQADRDGSFTNTAILYASYVDGSGSAASTASSSVYLEGTGQAPRYPAHGDWQPPDWDFRASEEGLRL